MLSSFGHLVIGSVSLLIALYANKYEEIDRNRAFPENPNDLLLPQVKEYDFIIVGAGSAGSTVAHQLSKEFNVLLLEAGGNPIPQTYVPGYYGYVLKGQKTMYWWNSIRQTHSTLDDDGIAVLGQGKFVGGSSVVNGISYNRGSPNDYDNWANITGDESWKYENLLQYFKMTEDFREEKNSDGHLGVGGPLTLRRSSELKSSYKAFIDGAKELGYKEFINSNAPQTEGFGCVTETVSHGRRVSVYDAFIKPILDRKTLTVLRYAQVSKIDIDENKRAVGVHYTRHGVESYANAKLEVIVSAGTMNSPIILQRSGIGPEELLKAAKIPTKVNLPVGQSFQDHPYSFICADFEDESKDPLKDFGPKDVDDFLLKGTGPMSVAGWGVAGQAFTVSSMAKAEGQPNWPDIELILYHNSSLYIPNGSEKTRVCMLCILGRVLSRGSISLDLSNHMNSGIWNPQWLAHERDAKVIAEAVKLAAAVFESQAFKSIGVKLDKTIHPSCKHEEFGTDKYWQCYVRRRTKTTWHPVGTCRMGSDNDKNSVVDTKLRVKGIKGLRVIDNSIQPVITNANTNAPAILIGQKGAAMILSEYKDKTKQ